MSKATQSVETILHPGAKYSLAKVESVLRDHLPVVADMDDETARTFRRSILEATPFAPLIEDLLAGSISPDGAFASLLSGSDVSELKSSERTLMTLLHLATYWEAGGQPARAAAMAGLLIRVGIAIGYDRLVAESAERLVRLVTYHASATAVSMSADDANTVHAAWRRWGTSHQTHCPDTLARLARIVQETQDSAVRGHLAELAVWERLIRTGGSSLEPQQRSQTLRRMIELCSLAESCSLAFAVRGTGLLPLWARAAVAGSKTAPRGLRGVLETARKFESTMTRGGISTARSMVATSLEATHREVVRQWPSLPAVWECALGIARLRRATIEPVDATAYERLIGLLRTTARFAAGELASKLRVECMELVALWIGTGDETATVTARRMLQCSAPSGEHRELLARAGLHLSLGCDDHGEMHLRSAHHLARMAYAKVDAPTWERGRAALFAALAGLRLNELDGSFQRGADARRLRSVALTLVERARESARQSECSLLGRILLTLARLRLREALRRTGAPRRVLVGQATRDADHAERLFHLAQVMPRALEARWLKARILAADSGANSDRIGAGLRQVRSALEALGDARAATSFVGDHTWGLPLGHCVCHDYVQFLNAALMPDATGDSLQRPPTRDFQDLRHIDSGTWMRYLLHPLEAHTGPRPAAARVFGDAIAA